MSSVVIFVYRGIVDEVYGARYTVVDLDNLEQGICPVCGEDICNNCCEYCKINWDEEGRDYDYLYRKICEG